MFGVCTGSLLLGAAGLLSGKRAGGHWESRELLSQFGAIVSNDRMTLDGNFYTSGGVTSGIDMALKVVGDIAGIEVAQKIQLAMEYDPAHHFSAARHTLLRQRSLPQCVRIRLNVALCANH